MNKKRICMWSGPRNVSTAFMYAFANRGDCHVVDEPFYAYYLYQTGVNHPGREKTLQAYPQDFDKVLKELVMGEFEKDLLFLKNMPHHMVSCSTAFADDLTNFFLVREPRAMISSFIKKIPTVSMQDLGLKQQWELYSNLIETGANPPVIDSAELLMNPELVLNELCVQLDIPFKSGMLQWPAGPIPEDGIWAKYWYASVHASTGWAKQQSTDTSIPAHLEGLARECEMYYELFRSKAIRP